ncbi:CAP domain-containing protein [Oricola sp.]|uniref:CAP domain-containing protein n=1 Tax=Oricola sp. TaxID=1979950 RepID=UPI0025F70A09|nr:CAP domain-containing protein [Oricola sp.]MCI5078231.1 CAP domain-containing protein [Oricola sp.]
MDRRFFVIGGVAALGLGVSGCSTAGLLDLSVSGGDSEIVTGKVLASVNRLRAAEGKPRLSSDRNLGRQAREHAEYMARKGRMSHDNFARRMKRWNIDLPAAENVAEGQKDAAGMFEAFRRSPKHFDNMLVGDFRKLGVGVARDRNGRNYWVMGLSG